MRTGFVDNFFRTLEDKIESKWDSIRCKDVYELYFDFWEKLKKETGSATGFTGPSEVIVFMIIKKLIEREYGKLEAHEYTKDTYYLFNSNQIWKNPSEDLKRITPDRAIEIKVYTARKSKESVRAVIDLLKSIKIAKKSFKGMLILYSLPSKFEDIKDILKNEKDWLTWIVLKDSDENFVEILRAWLEYSDRQV